MLFSGKNIIVTGATGDLGVAIVQRLISQGANVPRVYCRRLDFQLYGCWAVKDGTRVSEFVDACCPLCAKAEFIGLHFFDKALDELNRMYSLIDNRTENR
jgi:NAD(P)-dependent dehydrogenase (short-subunit alcohol dehydrogenase family)